MEKASLPVSRGPLAGTCVCPSSHVLPTSTAAHARTHALAASVALVLPLSGGGVGLGEKWEIQGYGSFPGALSAHSLTPWEYLHSSQLYFHCGPWDLGLVRTEDFGWLGDRDEGAVTESDPRLCVCVWGWFLAVCLWTCFGCRCFWCLQMVYLCLGLCVCVYRVTCTV